MDQEVLRLWLDALRSGDYEQGLGTLRTSDNKYCCLGVLCDLHNKKADHGGVGWYQPEFLGSGWYYGDNGSELSDDVMRWAGLDPATTPRDPALDRDKVSAVLGREVNHDEVSIITAAACNDDLRMNFPQIADVLEACFSESPS